MQSILLAATLATLQMWPEFARPDPFGAVVSQDRSAATPDLNRVEGARGGYVSFHLVVKTQGDYSLSFEIGGGKLQAGLYREWFHFTEADKKYYPDALIPVTLPYKSRLPEPDNRIPQQTAQAFWVDVWISPEAAPGLYRATATLVAGGRSVQLPLQIQVLGAVVPEIDAIAVDHNSYGSSFLGNLYPKLNRPGFFESDALFSLIHAYHRLFYEHRGVFHQLGYGHGGKVGPEFAPALAGSGRGKHVSSWDLYDRHYGPLLDGSAFAGSRRGARPIPFAYLPVNPEWPASFLWWGEPGYEAEFVNVVSEMERHFREKGWTKTRFELFFNHKKRYKAFPWDGDEVRFPDDDRYFLEYGRLWKKAVPPDTPVQFVFRNDVSWSMERQFRLLAGVVNFWVAGGSEMGWFPEAPKMLQDRGDIVWIYGGTPAVSAVSSAITKDLMRTWIYGVGGFCRWLTVDPGRDPWFHFDGGGTALAYPGERFGIPSPIPSLRLKLQRNCIQDLNLLSAFARRRSLDQIQAEVTARYNQTQPRDWWPPRPSLVNLPPYEWTNTAIEEAAKPAERRLFGKLDAAAWQRVREYVMRLAAEAP